MKTVAQVPPLLMGENALNELPQYLQQWECDSILLVSDEGLNATGLVASIAEMLEKHCSVTTFLAPAGEPKVATVNEAANQVRAMNKPLVVGLGGGTALDIAKLTAGLAASTHPMEHYLLCANPWQGSAVKVMIPTTSGTGAEVTRTCVLSDANGNKSWAWGDELSPELVVLDPSTSQSMPAAITVMTGLDALVHAMEAATAQNRDNVSAASALKAIRLVITHLPECLDNPNNLPARLSMQQGAYLAGIAIDNCGTGIAHNIGHALGTLYHIPHGIAVTVGLAASLEWSLQTDSDNVYQDCAQAMHCDKETLVSCFFELLNKVNFSQCLQRFSKVNIDAQTLAQCMQTTENLPMANNSSRIPQQQDWLMLAENTVQQFNVLQS